MTTKKPNSVVKAAAAQVKPRPQADTDPVQLTLFPLPKPTRRKKTT